MTTRPGCALLAAAVAAVLLQPASPDLSPQSTFPPLHHNGRLRSPSASGAAGACVGGSGVRHEIPSKGEEGRRLFIAGFPPPGPDDRQIALAFTAIAGPVENVAAEEYAERNFGFVTMGSREAAAAAIRAAEAGLFSGIVNSVNFSTYPAPSPKTFAREYGKNGLGWGKAPVGEKPCVTIGIVCPTSHVERVRGYIRDVFDLEVVTVSGEAFAASRVRQLHVDACANQLPDRPKTVPAGQMNMRVILARPAAQGASSSIVQSRILAARLEADPLLARSAQRAFPLGVVGEGHAVEVGAWSGVAASAAEAVDAIFPFLPLGASVRVAAFPKFAQDKLVKLLDARGVTLSPTANSVAISAVVADSGWWHLFLSRTDPSDPASAPRDADSGAASRAFFKIGEALVRCKEEGAVPGCLAIDVGAAPGGWSQNLVARGCTQVIAVDPAPLNLEPPIGEALLRHMPIMIEEAVPILLAEGRAASLSVYVCDMVYQPGTCPIGILESCIPLLVPKALCIVTLKGAAGHSAASVEIGFAAKIAAFRLLCPGAQVLHLMANRERERTLVGHLA